MFPTLFSIGPLTLHTYGVFVALAALLGLIVTVRLSRGYGLSNQQIMDMGFIIILSAIIGSRLMYVGINLKYYLQNPLDILKIWQGGLVFSGGIVCVIFSMAWYVRRSGFSLLKMGDLWSPAASLAQGFGRIGCFMAGCCYGKPTDLKWGVAFTHPETLAPPNVPLHPTQIYSAMSGFVIFLILLFIHKRREFAGQVFLWFLILHSTARLGLERFRGDDRGLVLGGDMTATQLVAFLILMAAIATLIFLKAKKK